MSLSALGAAFASRAVLLVKRATVDQRDDASVAEQNAAEYDCNTIVGSTAPTGNKTYDDRYADIRSSTNEKVVAELTKSSPIAVVNFGASCLRGGAAKPGGRGQPAPAAPPSQPHHGASAEHGGPYQAPQFRRGARCGGGGSGGGAKDGPA